MPGRRSPKNIDRPRVKGAFHRLSSSRRPGRIEARTLLAGKRPPDRKRSESAVTNPADAKRTVQKIPKLVQRIRLGRNLPSPSRPPCGASIARRSILPFPSSLRIGEARPTFLN